MKKFLIKLLSPIIIWVRFSTLLGLAFILSVPSSFSARMPNSVPKTFTVTNQTALAWAKLLGLNPKEKQNLIFPLHPMDAHALSLRLNSNPPDPPTSNVLNFNPDPPSLTLSGNWMDQETGSAESKKPRYVFGSPFIPENLQGAGPWGDLLRSLGFSEKGGISKKNGEVLKKQSTATNWFPWTEKRPWLEVKVYRMESFEETHKDYPWGYQVVIGVEGD